MGFDWDIVNKLERDVQTDERNRKSIAVYRDLDGRKIRS